jgi:hypothetical protein
MTVSILARCNIIMHTVRYTELRSDRFDGFWKD